MSKFNDDELEPPSWMDREFFEKILRESEADDGIEVSRYEISPATQAGDHYASVMFRSTIQFKSGDQQVKDTSLIVKTMPYEEGAKKEMFKDSKIFETEIGVYHALGTFEDILRSCGDATVLRPKLLYSSLDPIKILVMEDLSKKGYETLRHRQTNTEEAKMAISKLAKWHALSYKSKLEGDDALTGFRDHFFNIPGLTDIPFFADGLKVFIETLKKFPEFETYVGRFEKLLDGNLIQRCIDLFNDAPTSDCNYLVLNHGDFHVKNLMFKANEKGGHSEDVILLDFQICAWGPAVADIIYFLFMLFDAETRMAKRDEIIYFYYTEFVQTLRRTGFGGRLPRLTELHEDMIKYKDFEIFNFTTFGPMIPVFFGGQGDFDMDKVMNGDMEYRAQFFNNPRFIDEIRRVLPFYLHRGYLD